MESEKKKKIAFIILLLLLFFSGLFYFIFQTFLNKGTLIISENSKTSSPFFVTERRLGTVECRSLPCEIELFAGEKDMFFQKESYKDLNIRKKIPLFGKTTLELEMKLVPFISSSDLKLEPISNPYRLLTDSLTGFQKLVNIKDPLAKPISFLPNKLETPKYFVGKNHVLITNSLQNPILININTGEKSFIKNIFKNINKIILSDDGKAIAFLNPETKNLNIYFIDSSETVIETEINFEKTNIVFDSLNNIFFVSPDYSSENSLTFGHLFIEKNEVEILLTSNEIDEKVEQIFLTEDERELYFKTKSGVYKLTMY